MSVYPNVPPVPGVPPLLRLPGAIYDPPTLDEPEDVPSQPPPVWGIFDTSGMPVAISDSFATLRYKSPAKVANFQIEGGSFASYDKVQLSAMAGVVLTCGGSDARRQAFLSAIDAAKKSLNLYSIITPDAQYLSYSIDDYDYRRESNRGAYLIIVELMISEIRTVNSTYTTVAQQPSGADPANAGRVQAAPIPPSVLSAIGTDISGFMDSMRQIFQ